MAPKLRKKRVDKAIHEGFWDGFQAGLGLSSAAGLSYSSASGWYGYNPVRRLAEAAGREFAEQTITDKLSGKCRVSCRRYEVPAEAVAVCYAEAGFRKP